MLQHSHSLGIYQREIKTYVHKNVYKLFIATLHVNFKNGKQPKCPRICEWINNLWYLHTVEQDRKTHNNVAEFQNLILSERCQT